VGKTSVMHTRHLAGARDSRAWVAIVLVVDYFCGIMVFPGIPNSLKFPSIEATSRPTLSK
jgi:hypothetical protein